MPRRCPAEPRFAGQRPSSEGVPGVRARLSEGVRCTCASRCTDWARFSALGSVSGFCGRGVRTGVTVLAGARNELELARRGFSLAGVVGAPLRGRLAARFKLATRPRSCSCVLAVPDCSCSGSGSNMATFFLTLPLKRRGGVRCEHSLLCSLGDTLLVRCSSQLS